MSRLFGSMAGFIGPFGPLASRPQTNDQIAEDPRFNTQLTPEEELRFRTWKSQYAPKDSGYDYDLPGAFKAGFTPHPVTGHWLDTFKKPNHPTFSTQSKYSQIVPGRAGTWSGENYVPPQPPQENLLLKILRMAQGQ